MFGSDALAFSFFLFFGFTYILIQFTKKIVNFKIFIEFYVISKLNAKFNRIRF